MFVLSVSQCPTSALSFSNASAPPPGAAFVVTAIVPMHNTTTPKFLAKPFIDVSPFKKYFRSKKNTLIQISSSTSRGNRADAIPLRGVAHNHSHDAAGQDDLQIVAVLHVGDEESQHEANGHAKQDPQRHGIHLSSKDAGSDPGNKPLDGGPDNNARELSAYRRREPGGRPVNP